MHLYPPLPQGCGVHIISFVSSFVKEISVGLLGKPEVRPLQLGEDLENQGLHMHEDGSMAYGCHRVGVYSWNLLGRACDVVSGEPWERELTWVIMCLSNKAS